MSVLDNMMLGASRPDRRAPAAGAVPGRVGAQETAIELQALELLDAVPARSTMRDDYRRQPLGRPAQAARDGPGADGRPRDDHARRADGRREPGADESLLGHIKALRDEGVTVCSSSTTWTWSRTSPTGSCAWPRAASSPRARRPHRREPGGDRRLPRRTTTTRVRSTGAGGWLRPRPAARGQRSGRGLPARRGHPQRLQPDARRERDRRHHRAQRRRQVDAGEGDVRAGAASARQGARSTATTSPRSRPTSSWSAASATCRRPTTCSRR